VTPPAHRISSSAPRTPNSARRTFFAPDAGRQTPDARFPPHAAQSVTRSVVRQFGSERPRALTLLSGRLLMNRRLVLNRRLVWHGRPVSE
jgi:hypothetical protein